MRIPRFMAAGVGMITLALAYYLTTVAPLVEWLTNALVALGVIFVALVLVPIRSRHWRVFAHAFLMHGVAMAAASVTAAILDVPIGADILLLLAGAVSSGAWIVMQRYGRRHSLSRLNANYFRET